MLQSVIKIGNSLGTTLPRDFVVKNKIKAGSKIKVDHTNGSITYSANTSTPTEYETVSDKEFLKAVEDVELRYGKALDELANL